MLTGRAVEHDHADKERGREQRSDRSGPRRTPTTPRPQVAIPAPRLPSVRSATRRGAVVGGALVAAVVVVVGAVVLLSSRTAAPVDTAAAVPETIASLDALGAGSSVPVDGASLSVTPSGTATGGSASGGSASVPGVPAPVPAPGPAVSSSAVSNPSGSNSSGSVSTRPSSSVPPGLDPAKIWGYRSVHVITQVENGGDLVLVGARSENIYRCSGGLCRSVRGLKQAAFAPAVQQYSHTSTSSVPGFRADSPCMPITATFTITRQGDGSYRGSGSAVPKAVRSSAGSQFCSWPSSSGTYVLTPILLPELDPAAEAGPAALDPARITGYTGNRVVGGRQSPVSVECDRGLCVLACPLLGCNGSSVFFTAATSSVRSGPITLGSSCSGSTGNVDLTRDAAGGYLVRSTAKAAGAPDACTSDTRFRLTPTTG